MNEEEQSQSDRPKVYMRGRKSHGMVSTDMEVDGKHYGKMKKYQPHKVKLSDDEIKELAGVIFGIEVIGTFGRYDLATREKLSARLSDIQIERLDNYFENIQRPSEKGIYNAIKG
jgi:hypothetical protein